MYVCTCMHVCIVFLKVSIDSKKLTNHLYIYIYIYKPIYIQATSTVTELLPPGTAGSTVSTVTVAATLTEQVSIHVCIYFMEN